MHDRCTEQCRIRDPSAQHELRAGFEALDDRGCAEVGVRRQEIVAELAGGDSEVGDLGIELADQGKDIVPEDDADPNVTQSRAGELLEYDGSASVDVGGAEVPHD